MEVVSEIAVFAALTIVTTGIALVLGRLCLYGLFAAMPARHRQVTAGVRPSRGAGPVESSLRAA